MIIKALSRMKGESKMKRKEDVESYPLRSLHDFLSELDKEWDSFRTASLIGILTSGILLVFVIFRLLALLATLRRPGVGLFAILNDLLFLVLVVAFVVYEIFLLLRQYRFFKKWERRVGLLLHLEERLMGGMERREAATNEGLHKEDERRS